MRLKLVDVIDDEDYVNFADWISKQDFEPNDILDHSWSYDTIFAYDISQEDNEPS